LGSILVLSPKVFLHQELRTPTLTSYSQTSLLNYHNL
jgi:hypothetical protein